MGVTAGAAVTFAGALLRGVAFRLATFFFALAFFLAFFATFFLARFFTVFFPDVLATFFFARLFAVFFFAVVFFLAFPATFLFFATFRFFRATGLRFFAFLLFLDRLLLFLVAIFSPSIKRMLKCCHFIHVINSIRRGYRHRGPPDTLSWSAPSRMRQTRPDPLLPRLNIRD